MPQPPVTASEVYTQSAVQTVVNPSDSTDSKAQKPSNGHLNDSSKSHDTPVTPSTGTSDPAKSKKDTTILPTNTKGLHTVFIHKLYNMLEDEELKHLIWWTPSNESFMIVPGEEFSRALSQYFKHTNVASFVRQLNMYGFHKVSDVASSIPTETPDVTTWEFRHSSGSFRKGDIDSLKQIKRRSSKHTSGRTTHLDPGMLSDTEISSERSNSVVEYPQDPSTVDPMLNVRLAELGHNLASLRHEHARLQLRYDTAISDMRKTNLDMVYLLDIMQKLIHSSNPETENARDALASPKPHQIIPQQPDDLASPGSGIKPPQQSQPYTLQDVEADIARFRATIIQRAAHKDQFDQFSVPFAPSYQIDQRPGQFPQQPIPVPGGNQSPADTSAMATEPQRYPYTSPYPYPPQYQPFLQAAAQTPHGVPVGPPGMPPQQPDHQQMVHDPFRSDRKSSRSSNRSRNMSILCDPLQPSAAATTSSPMSGTNIHRGSVTGNEPSSYFPEYRPYPAPPGPARIHTPEPPQGGYKMTPAAAPSNSSRDQRAGSFPVIAPGVQNALRGEGVLMRKRHSSNDAVFGLDNPPRSVPDDGFNTQMPRKSLSTSDVRPVDVKSLKQQQQQQPYQTQSQLPQPPQLQPPHLLPPQQQNTPVLQKQGSGTGLHALLNPERRDSVSAQPLAKKPRT